MTLRLDPFKPAQVKTVANQTDEEFGEEFVAQFIARANAMRHDQGLPNLGVGALRFPISRDVTSGSWTNA